MEVFMLLLLFLKVYRNINIECKGLISCEFRIKRTPYLNFRHDGLLRLPKGLLRHSACIYTLPSLLQHRPNIKACTNGTLVEGHSSRMRPLSQMIEVLLLTLCNFLLPHRVVVDEEGFNVILIDAPEELL